MGVCIALGIFALGFLWLYARQHWSLRRCNECHQPIKRGEKCWLQPEQQGERGPIEIKLYHEGQCYDLREWDKWGGVRGEDGKVYKEIMEVGYGRRFVSLVTCSW